MSLRGEFCRILDKYKSGKWSRDKAAAALARYFLKHVRNIEKTPGILKVNTTLTQKDFQTFNSFVQKREQEAVKKLYRLIKNQPPQNIKKMAKEYLIELGVNNG